MGILALIILGGLVGWLTGFFVNKKGGIIWNIIIGIIGSILGGYVFQLLGGEGITGLNLYSILVGIVGSILLVCILNLFK